MQKNDSRRRVSSMSFAGWLFADVLIVLFVVFMGSEVRHSRVEAATPSPSASSQINKVGVLEKKIVKFTLVGVDQRGIKAKNSEAISALKVLIEQNTKYQSLSKANRYSPVVLVFSHYKNPDTSLASKTSEAACELSTSLQGSIFDKASICRTFIDGKLAYGQVRFEVFLVANQ